MIGMRDDRIGGIFPHGSEQHAMRISSVSWRTICREPERQAAESIVAERRIARIASVTAIAPACQTAVSPRA